MPYELQPASEGKYYVINSDTGKRMSEEPMPKSRAVRQLKALRINVEAEEKKAIKEYDGAMIAFMLPPVAAQALAVPDRKLPAGSQAQPAGDMHLTLVYLGGWDPGEKEKMISVLAEFARSHEPVAGSIGGFGRFTSVDEGGGKNAIYASFDAEALPEFRQDLVDALKQAGVKYTAGHGYTPHITLAYVPADAPVALSPPEIELVLDRICLAIGDERQEFPLTWKPELMDLKEFNIPKDIEAQGSSLTVLKDAKGDWRWITFSSNAFRDRDGEIVSTKALEDDCDRADRTKEYGPLRFWHMPGLDIGDCDFNMVTDRTLVESGTFRSPALGQAVSTRSKEFQISLGFTHPLSQPDREGVFHTIRRFERSLVPRGKVANPFTRLFAYTQYKEGDLNMATLQEKLKAMRDLLGDDELVDTVLKGTKGVEAQATKEGVQFKEAAEEVAEEALKMEKKPMKGDDDEEDVPAEDKKKSPPPPPPAAESDEGDEEDMDEEEEEGTKEFGGPYLGDLHPSEYAQLMGDVLAAALQPLAIEVQSLKELTVTQKEAADEQAGEQSELLGKMQENVKQLSARLKELEGDVPPGADYGYRPSQDDDTIIDEDDPKFKDARPGPDPLNEFMGGLGIMQDFK